LQVLRSIFPLKKPFYSTPQKGDFEGIDSLKIREITPSQLDVATSELALEGLQLLINFVHILLELGRLEGNATLRTLDARTLEFPNRFFELGLALRARDLDFSIVVNSVHVPFLSFLVSNRLYILS